MPSSARMSFRNVMAGHSRSTMTPTTTMTDAGDDMVDTAQVERGDETGSKSGTEPAHRKGHHHHHHEAGESVASKARKSFRNVLGGRAKSTAGEHLKQSSWDRAGNEVLSPEHNDATTQHTETEEDPSRKIPLRMLGKSFRRAKSAGTEETQPQFGAGASGAWESEFAVRWHSDDATDTNMPPPLPRATTEPRKSSARLLMQRSFTWIGVGGNSRRQMKRSESSGAHGLGTADAKYHAGRTQDTQSVVQLETVPPSQRAGVAFSGAPSARTEQLGCNGHGNIFMKMDSVGMRTSSSFEPMQSIRGEASDWNAVPRTYVPLAYDELSEPDSEHEDHDMVTASRQGIKVVCPEKVDSSVGSLCSDEVREFEVGAVSGAPEREPWRKNKTTDSISTTEGLLVKASQSFKRMDSFPPHLYESLLSPRTYTSLSSVSDESADSGDSQWEWW